MHHAIDRTVVLVAGARLACMVATLATVRGALDDAVGAARCAAAARNGTQTPGAERRVLAVDWARVCIAGLVVDQRWACLATVPSRDLDAAAARVQRAIAAHLALIPCTPL